MPLGSIGGGGGSGTVTSVATGTGLTGGAITSTGTIDLDFTSLTEIDWALDDFIPNIDTSDGNAEKKGAVDRLLGRGPNVAEGRLTLTTATSVTTADVTAAGTLYYTPHVGNRIRIYDGTRWKMYTFTERSLALTLTSGKNYDVFIYDNAGTLTLELSAAWTDDTTRADALATQDGVVVKSGATTRLHLGTIRASASNQTEDSRSKRYVSNRYHRVKKQMYAQDGTDNWTYTTATFRERNGGSTLGTSRVGYVHCDTGIMAWAMVYSTASNSSATNIALGIGIDSSSVDSSLFSGSGVYNVFTVPVVAAYEGFPGLGEHEIHALEWSTAAGTTTWYGDAGITTWKSGLIAWSEF